MNKSLQGNTKIGDGAMEDQENPLKWKYLSPLKQQLYLICCHKKFWLYLPIPNLTQQLLNLLNCYFLLNWYMLTPEHYETTVGKGESSTLVVISSNVIKSSSNDQLSIRRACIVHSDQLFNSDHYKCSPTRNMFSSWD